GNVLPLTNGGDRVLVIAFGPGSDASTGAGFTARLSEMLPDHRVRRIPLDSRSAKAEFDAAAVDAADHDVVIIASYASVGAGGALSLSPLQAALANRLAERASPVVVVTFGNPYLVMEIDPPDAYL